ncbi:MAG: hypothetical protein ACYDES_01850 [Acidimicrobiales bacterium]
MTDARPEQHPAGAPDELGGEGQTRWLADYVYGTISTLVAIAGLTFETNPGALTTAGVVVVGAVAIWLAHTLSRLVLVHSWKHLHLTGADVWEQLRGSWSIASAAIPAAIVFVFAGAHVWKVRTAFVIAEVVGVLALAVIGVVTAGRDRESLFRRFLYVAGFVSVGVAIVLLESLVHLL